MIAFPNAKLNFGLNITAKRADGYHNIDSIFLPIDWHDVLEIIPSDQFVFTSSGLPIPGDLSSNLCVKAYELLKADFDLPPVKMHLHKVIPMGAGLGGGSSDGSFALKMLNDLFLLQLSQKQLEAYAKRLGADCPFFIDNQQKYVTGIGDLMEPVSVDLSGLTLVVVCPSIHVSTQTAFRGIVPNEPRHQLLKSATKPRESWRHEIKNDFESTVFTTHPAIQQVKKTLLSSGAVYAAMTGTGSAVFGFFEAEPKNLKFQDCHVWRQSL